MSSCCGKTAFCHMVPDPTDDVSIEADPRFKNMIRVICIWTKCCYELHDFGAPVCCRGHWALRLLVFTGDPQ